MLGSNASPEEILKFHGHESPKLAELLESMLDRQDEVKEMERRFYRTEELLEEQVSFARELVENIQHSVERCTSAKQAREAVRRCLDESYFEL